MQSHKSKGDSPFLALLSLACRLSWFGLLLTPTLLSDGSLLSFGLWHLIWANCRRIAILSSLTARRKRLEIREDYGIQPS